ncbi:MAG: HD domain-containing protein, partial [Pseudomonadota bacterium]
MNTTDTLLNELSAEIDMEDYPQVILLCEKQSPGENENLVTRALEFASRHHRGQVRRSGEHYITHPLATAEIIASQMGITDPEIVAAAILHDLVEDIDQVENSHIVEQFGETVACYVQGCTKIRLLSAEPKFSKDETYKQMLTMGSEYPEILLIKIADRLHNMETLASLPEKKRQRIALETIEVYAPLAGMLKMFPFKRRLYHLAIRQRFPQKSKKLSRAIQTFIESNNGYDIEKLLEQGYAGYPFPVKVRIRPKTLWSYYSPQTNTIKFEHAENQLDITIVLHTDDPGQCYTALGFINRNFSPVPKTIRDYIANQKESGYQSLHVGIKFNNLDYLVKIRTHQMDQSARKGILLHSGSQEVFARFRSKITDELRHIGEYKGDPLGRKKMLHGLRNFDEIYVYTPKGDIYTLPKGSIVMDFAYSVHTGLGDDCSHARVNKRRVEASQVLEDGDTVEIVKEGPPVEMTAALENRCRTTKAQNFINKRILTIRNTYAASAGKTIILQELDRYLLDPAILESREVSDFLVYKRYKDLDQWFTRIGQDVDSPLELLSEFGIKPYRDAPLNRLLISGLIACVHKFSKCCNPIPADRDVVAALSVRGVSFHRETCQKLADLEPEKKKRLVNIRWDMDRPWQHPIRFTITIHGIQLNQCLSYLSAIPATIRVNTIREKTVARGKAAVTIELDLAGFQES